MEDQFAIERSRRAMSVSRVASRALIYSGVILAGLIANPGRLSPQILIRGSAFGGAVQLIGNDAAVLDTAESKKDLPCTVTPVKPILGFDLRFHSEYQITIPLKELSGNGDTLTIVFRVASATA